MLLDVRHLTLYYATKMGDVHAVDDVTFSLENGEAMGLVGESGCGKTTLALALLRLLPDNAKLVGGQALFAGLDLVRLPESELRKIRWRGMSMIFQAAMNSLNPVYRVGDQIIEAMQAHMNIGYKGARRRVAELFELVGLAPQLMDRFPHEYSGGMKQRAVIAMALACDPKLVIADEPTTALDVIVQDRILRRLDEVRRKLDMAMLYISHDIAVIAEVSHRLGVMYAGNLVEFGETRAVFAWPAHPYTRALLSAFPAVKGEKRKLQGLPGEPPDLLQPPPGCRFHPRCPVATELCTAKPPPLEMKKPGHFVACWHPHLGGP